jgi:hypothetical protein
MPQPPLRSLHPDASWNAVKLRQLDRLATGDLVRSLAPGQTNCPRRAPTGLCWRATTGFTFCEGEPWTSIDCRGKSLQDPKPEERVEEAGCLTNYIGSMDRGRGDWLFPHAQGAAIGWRMN